MYGRLKTWNYITDIPTEVVNLIEIAGITDDNNINALADFVSTLKNKGVWTDILYANMISPKSLDAARYDLVDYLAPGVINGTLNHAITGVTGDGVTGFLDLVRNGVTKGWNIGDFGVTWSVRNDIQSGTDIGVLFGGNELRMKSRNGLNTSFYYGKFKLIVFGANNSIGIHTMTSNATTTFGYRNGVQVGTDSIGSQGMPDGNIYAWALSKPGGLPSETDFSAHEINAIIFHKHLTPDKVIILRNAIQVYNSQVISGGR